MAETQTVRWFKDNVSENVDDLIKIGELANKQLCDCFSIEIPDPQTTIAMYAKIFDAIVDTAVARQNEYDNFCINVANRLQIGYTNVDNEDDEKTGNFMIFIKHMENSQSDMPMDDDETTTVELCTQWCAANIKVQPEIMKEIATLGKKYISELINLKVTSNEFIIPIFCVVHRQILAYAKIKRGEIKDSEYELNVAGLYTLIISETDDAEEEISYIPSISSKLSMKNDSTASRED